MATLNQTIAENISIALAKTGETQTHLANAVGIDKSRMSRILADESPVSAVELFAIACYFGVPAQWFSEPRLEELAVAA
ncbi:helix-turn-helix domain-containing protein [Rothia nasimurium]|uniref:helix-turn-helix domain-containing protein n=1 Tax=Rothia nasimurium TaxID=85336 RepID=UPI001F42F218|nr:helix-turn-helix transcriptional regulator [Rothia nasimurium]